MLYPFPPRGQRMNYGSRSGSSGNSSTASRSSDPRGRQAVMKLIFLLAVRLSEFSRFFLPFFSVSMFYFIISVPIETVWESTRA